MGVYKVDCFLHSLCLGHICVLMEQSEGLFRLLSMPGFGASQAEQSIFSEY